MNDDNTTERLARMKHALNDPRNESLAAWYSFGYIRSALESQLTDQTTKDHALWTLTLFEQALELVNPREAKL